MQSIILKRKIKLKLQKVFCFVLEKTRLTGFIVAGDEANVWLMWIK